MRSRVAAVTVGAALLLGSAAPAVAEPAEQACRERPNGAMHGTDHAHDTVPHRTEGNDNAHSRIPHYCVADHS